MIEMTPVTIGSHCSLDKASIMVLHTHDFDMEEGAPNPTLAANAVSAACSRSIHANELQSAKI